MGETIPGNGNRFRITAQAAEGRAVLRLEGWLAPTDLALLDAACDEARRRGEAVVLELSGLRSLHDGAVCRLAELARSGVELVGASGFVTALLRSTRQP